MNSEVTRVPRSSVALLTSLALSFIGSLVVANAFAASAEPDTSLAHGAVAVRADDPTKPAVVPNDYVITPFGYFHPSCVQSVGTTEKLHDNGNIMRADGTVRAVAACAFPSFRADGTRVEPQGSPADATRVVPAAAYNGYLELVSFKLTTGGVNEMTGYMRVPAAPSRQVGQTIFLFPGLEDFQNVQSILQPVLGWNADGGNTWTIRSWNCCRSGTVFAGNTATVSPGDVIFGSMVKTGTQSWTISAQDISRSSVPVATLNTTDSQPFNWIMGASLETYGITACNQLPASKPAQFVDVQAFINGKVIANPTWSSVPGGTISCTSATVLDSTDININY